MAKSTKSTKAAKAVTENNNPQPSAGSDAVTSTQAISNDAAPQTEEKEPGANEEQSAEPEAEQSASGETGTGDEVETPQTESGETEEKSGNQEQLRQLLADGLNAIGAGMKPDPEIESLNPDELTDEQKQNAMHLDDEMLDLLSRLMEHYPQETVFHFTSDNQVFLDKNLSDAKAHQKIIAPGEEIKSISVA